MRPVAAERVPAGRSYVFEPKIDGWRAILWCGARPRIQSRHTTILDRYFPDLLDAASAVPGAAVLDGELVVAVEGRIDFDALGRRVTAGRGLSTLAAREPASLIAWDLLQDTDGTDLRDRPLWQRRMRLEELLEHRPSRIEVCPATDDRGLGRAWLESPPPGCEGIVVKDPRSRYRPGREAGAWVKLRHRHPTDMLVGGVTGSLDTPTTLLLGAVDQAGRLRYLARTVPLGPRQRAELGRLLPELRAEGLHPWPQPIPAAWNGHFGDPLPFTAVEPVLIVEVDVDLARSGASYRHPVRLRRVRIDRLLDGLEPPPR